MTENKTLKYEIPHNPTINAVRTHTTLWRNKIAVAIVEIYKA